MASEPPAPDARRSIRIGKYEVLAHIATGGMGAVYKARDTELDRVVAIKVLPPELAANPALVERFRREARHAAKLRHKNIVTIFEAAEAQGTHFLVMEYVEGTDLHEYIERKGKLDPEKARLIVMQAAKALDHAHRAGLVHRDVKPSNFLLGKGEDGRIFVKLTDLGLAREVSDEQFRVTRTGTTVGTIDYISPEQARDSGKADGRSDIYSLGCTFFHMLAGRPPFCEGGLGERLLKHIEAEPPDVGQFNPQVPGPMREMLRKMLAKKPRDRYQTPAELLKELRRLDGTAPPPAASDRDILADLARAAAESPTLESVRPPTKRDSDIKVSRPPSSSTRRAAPARLRPRDEQDSKELPAPAPFRLPPKVWVIGGIAAALVLVAVIVAVVAFSRNPEPRGPRVSHDTHRGEPERPPAPEPEVKPDPPKPPPSPAPDVPPKPAGPPRLYKPALPIDADALARETTAPWARDADPPADAPVLRVVRLPREGEAGQFDSLAAACAAAPEGRTAVIEINDNGPLFVAPAAAAGRNLVVRAGSGFRPLLVCNPAAAAASGNVALLAVARGSLTLENLDVVLKWPDAPQGACLVRVEDGDFLARGCTFSTAGRCNTGLDLVCLEGSGPKHRCRLSRCVARGSALVAMDLRTPSADALLDGCLVVGSEQPLLCVAAGDDVPTTLRVTRSTLIGRHAGVLVRGATPAVASPAVRWVGWDVILAHGGISAGGEMVEVGEGAGTAHLEWQAVNCLYAGWRTLLGGRDEVTDLPGWRLRWPNHDGDGVLAGAWPPGEFLDPAELPARTFVAEGTPAGFAATAGPGVLGCDLAALPPAREGWLALTGEALAVPPLDYPTPDAPEIPAGDPDRFHGGRLDLGRTDLGKFLQEVQETKKLGPRVVLHLAGAGKRPTSPVRVKGCDLVLYFEPPPRLDARLVLTPFDAGAGRTEALIEVEDGSLEMIGGAIQYPDFESALAPPYLLKVRGGDLRLHGCRLEGPLTRPRDSFRGLVRFEGSPKADLEKAPTCAVRESVLLSARAAVEVVGPGARVGLQGCAVVSGLDAFVLRPGATAKPSACCTLEQTTVAARRTVLRLADVTDPPPPVAPLIFQSRACAYLNPFADPKGTTLRAGLLVPEGDALAHGLLVWQGADDVYDRRLHFAVGAAAAVPEKPQPHDVWPHLWGPVGDVQPVLDVAVRGTFDMDRLAYDRLVLPAHPRFKGRPPGADLVLLGLVKKAPRP